ncbi:MAG: glycoside hydrolase family 38 C-terminal domain-containing protein [Candidatus Hydrogenedentales bacterium]|jgi:hypothetical protein
MKAFYCVGTHWDREWYETFQEFRMWLVELIDDLLDLMEREPKFAYFHLDGQSVVLEDYLAIRPEQRERLLAMLKQGRILAGPWYVLPDEWLISGESFVRNLMTGMRVCRDLGVHPMPYAYTPDQFGHVATLPMIMAGFGLDVGIVWRGAQDENYPAQFVWVGPDGSRMLTHKLMDRGSYGPFDFLARRPLKEGNYSDESFSHHVEPYLSDEKKRLSAPALLLLDAIDHQSCDTEMIRAFEEVARRNGDIDFTWGTLPQYAEELRKHVDKLPERKGELREPARDAKRVGQYLIVHTISSRYPLKQRNDQCQSLMEKWVEPYALFQAMSGHKPILRYIDVAWEYLIKNQPHDSICGCSIDQVHRDMMYRYDQCAEIGDGVLRRAVAALGEADDAEKSATHVAVHNPLPFRRLGVFDLALPFAKDWPEFYIDGLCTTERVNKFTLQTKDGHPVPFQLTRIERETIHKRINNQGRRVTHTGDIYHVAAEMELPPCGHVSIEVCPSQDATRNFGTLLTGPLSATNGAISLKVNHDGTARVAHGATGRVFDGLFVYEDCGDSGDGWTRGKLINDLITRTPGTRVTVGLQEDGPLRTVFRIEREFAVPREMERRTWSRSDDRAVLKTTDWLSVQIGSPCIHVRTRVENTVKDHRFRVLFPTGVPCNHSFADTPFGIVERDILIPEETAAWHERINPEKAFTSLFGVQDGQGGLAVLSPSGLHEYEVTQTPERSLALTLFRSTFQTVATAGEPDGELLGTLDFEYLLYPFGGTFDAARALRIVSETQAGVYAHSRKQPVEERSFLEVTPGDAVVTAIKPAANGEGAVVRLWNPSDEMKHEVIRPTCKLASAHLCNLNEEVGSAILIKDNTIPVSVPPRGLASVLFTWMT